jgi:hypothetical protein
MSGLLRRIRRPGAAEETRTEPIALPEPAHGSAPTAPDGDPAPVRADGRPLPAGTGPEDLERRITTGRRGKLRRRARFLHRARELALRDLGGLVYEAHRREQDGGKLVAEKVGRLAAIDEELRGLETALATPRADTVLREPGVGGTCPRCGELHASDAHFCSSCGLDLTAAPAAAEAAAAPEPTTAEPAAPEAAAPAEPTTAEPAAQEAAAPEAATAAEPATPEADAAAEPAAPGASAAAEPATTELPPTTPDQGGNGRATTAETAARPEPADTTDGGRSA